MPLSPIGKGPLRIPRRGPGRISTSAPAFPGGPPAVTVIPWIWLQVPLELRANPPINSAQITRTNQTAATTNNITSQATYGVFAASATLDTVSPDDAQNFANWLTYVYANPLVRTPTLTLSLVYRTDDERALILGLEIGQRITLGPGTVQDYPGHTTAIPVPAGLPPGALSMLIEGIHHTSSVTDRIVEWTTSPLLGATPGAEGPWFRLDSSVLDGTDYLPF